MTVSFYSYKGGVGRTQLCANLASYLSIHRGMKVLLWDWDFEAPGLHRYYNKTDTEIQDSEKLGTLEILEKYIDSVRKKQNEIETDFNIDELLKANIINLRNKESRGRIDLLAAGNYNETYASRLIEFNWKEFAYYFDGILLIKSIKETLKQVFRYDFIIIDSRTGIGDYIGICNVLLPDTNVIIMSPNSQNFDGSLKTINLILSHPYVNKNHRKKFILPILSRLDTNSNSSGEWANKFIRNFSPFLVNLTNIEKDTKNKDLEHVGKFYFEHTFLPYSFPLSAGENLMFENSNDLDLTTSYRKNYRNIAEYLVALKSHGTIKELEREFSKDYDLRTSIKLLEEVKIKLNEYKELKNYVDKLVDVFSETIQNNPDSYEAWSGCFLN